MPKDYQIIQLENVDSTSRYLKDYVAQNQPQQPVFCTTQKQTAGYGQQKRHWLTNDKSAIFSLAYPLPQKYPLTGLVSLHIAALLHQSLVELTGDTLYLKWPNDLFNSQGKVAGMLIEQVMQKDYRAFIIGIGVNRDSPEIMNEVASSSSTSWFEINDLFSLFHQKVQQSKLVHYDEQELNEYWVKHGFFNLGESVQVIQPNQTNTDALKTEHGIYRGFDSHGHAKIEINGALTLVASGQISIRKI
ncbi:biotin--[acetyl-CoA-carboxylase] ligase [Thiomicrorhabdus sp. Milos-T2]|uniref:biotin--[acetyl-CoA-carboxylase] ligase n=1 Tax=Thiomicrorhabdus sp. Milos-T2 TaxID=90814 RepID=UPI00068E0110|nr:biotin--[acetyl-CoA-carboxylase] ligase [Thiomicrorhabdus sp. Milos-T2]